ncbi:hypothetical protein [[Mycobacterium] vasticus]|uniref:PEP-CTERM sorting domain-containing protein n=1 Tax=[Mycobacterium] vasticus TaxID=2875777 RepID=A0ABU5Z040_9MYCO|nr:hypothetical protein [Mycolicibacter sp. MYC017]MEB3070767.1 hypothetical protein [Mycolicibacter sp. MYC017]
MKSVALGVVAGGAVAAAFFTAAAANAEVTPTPAPTWAPNYSIDTAELLQGANSPTTWAVDSTFTKGSTVLEGTTYVTSSAGGFNTVFIDENKDVYNQNQLGMGFTNLYYDKGGDGKDVIDIIKTPFGNFDISSMASTFAPADMSKLTEASPAELLKDAGLYSALNLGLDKNAPADVNWSPTYGAAQLLADKDPFSQTWRVEDTTFTRGGVELTGTNYLTQSLFGGGINNLFVTEAGDVYNQNQLGMGFTNLYYDADGDGKDVIDIMKTPFGNFDISSLASWFAPTDYSDAVAATPLADLTDAGLYSALDLGLTPEAP